MQPLGPEVSNATPLGLAFVAVMMLLTLGLPRRWAFAPLLMTACWMTLGQRIVVAGINLPTLRLVIVAIFLRLLMRGEYLQIVWTKLDRVLLWSLITNFIAFVLLWRTGDAIINRLGLLFNGLGMYFGLRCWIRDRGDVVRAVGVLALILAPVAGMMANEKLTGRNWFSVLGGVPAITVIRNGALRCQGPFSHPILAGTVGAVWFPIFVGLYWSGQKRFLALVGMVAGVVMTVTSASSGPLFTLMTAIAGIGLWPLRRNMKMFRRAVVAALVVTQLSMNAPIWYLMARVNILSGSTGWHRANLIDTAFRRLPEWFLVGVKDVAAWGIFAGDVTNHYLIEGFRGGFITLVLFVWTMVLAYRYVGLSLRAGPPSLWFSGKDARLAWTLGAAIAAHMMTFLSVAYFDGQSMLNWYLAIALVVAYYLGSPRDLDLEQDGSAQPALPEPVWWHEAAAAAPPGAPELQGAHVENLDQDPEPAKREWAKQ